MKNKRPNAKQLQKARQEALRKLCERYYLEIKPNGPWHTSAEEDIAEYFTVPPVARLTKTPWVAVTMGHASESIWYLYPRTSFEHAREQAERHTLDDIYSEAPVAIHNLDTGEKFTVVKPVTFEWEKDKTT